MFRTFWKFVGVAVMALAVSAPVSHAKQRLLMGTSTGGGSYYVLGGTWSNALNGRLGDKVDLSIEVTGGPETNIMLIENKEMDLGMVTAWQAGDMYMAREKFLRNSRPCAPSFRCTPATSRFMPWRTPASRPSMISTASMSPLLPPVRAVSSPRGRSSKPLA